MDTRNSLLEDPFGRSVDYLRVSVTDRCNERCLYCMPEGFKGWQSRADTMTDDEILRVVRIAAERGFRKFRITGGEPLIRPRIVELARAVAQTPGVTSLAFSSNAVRLGPIAQPLFDAGVRGLNISLDALDSEIYHRVTGGKVEEVLTGIRAALAAGFTKIKLNCVLMRGVNECQIWPLIHFASEHQIPLRFIELMPLTRTDVLDESNFYPIGEVISLIRQREELTPEPNARLGHGPAAYYRLQKSGAMLGFIGAMTNLGFCEGCNKMRLTADGKIRPCLGDHGEIDLLSALRSGAGDEAIHECFQRALLSKPLAHTFREQYQPNRPMTAIGG